MILRPVLKLYERELEENMVTYSLYLTRFTKDILSAVYQD